MSREARGSVAVHWTHADGPRDVPGPEVAMTDAALDALLAGVRHAFGADLFALYAYGAITFPETEGTADLDYHVILERPPAPAQVTGYQAACARIGGDLDGWVILREQAGGARPPAHAIAGIPDPAWALHRAHWLAGRRIVAYGPPPEQVVVAPTWPEIAADLRYALAEARRSPHDAYAVLNACRVLHSFQTGDPVRSKFGSAQWALSRLPGERHPAIRAALATYRGEATDTDARVLARGRTPLFDLVDAELSRPTQ